MRIRRLFILASLIFMSFTFSAQASAPENAGLNGPLPINWSLLSTEKENFYILQIPDSLNLKAILTIEQEVPKNKFDPALLDQKLIELTTPMMEEKQILAGDFYKQGNSEHQKGMQTIFVKKFSFKHRIHSIKKVSSQPRLSFFIMTKKFIRLSSRLPKSTFPIIRVNYSLVYLDRKENSEWLLIFAVPTLAFKIN